MRSTLLVIALIVGLIAAFYYARHEVPESPPRVTIEATRPVVARAAPHETPEPAPPENPLTAAWAGVHERPDDPLAWSTLGDAQAAQDRLEAAKQSYRKAIRLGAREGDVYARLGFILYADQEDAEALAMLLEARRRGAKTPLLDWTVQTMQTRLVAAAPPEENHPGADKRDAEPEPAPAPDEEPEVDGGASHEAAALPDREPPGGPCEIAIRRRPHARAFTLPVDVDGVEATLILDTGASRTVLTDEFAARAGIYLDYGKMIRAVTANGVVDQPTAEISEIVIADRAISGTRVAICETCRDLRADGLLGLDVQSLLGMQLDLAGERIRFADCWE